uniref:Uncharacterized protein n=1 Tax=Setaria digitata TaxID=48799 RepID=A0A915Q287_9BILA
MAVQKVLVILLIIAQTAVQQSPHGHSHDIETPHYKYSRAANEEFYNFQQHGRFHHHHHHHHHEHSENQHTEQHDHFPEKKRHHGHMCGVDVEEGNQQAQQTGCNKQIKSNYKPYDPNGMLSFMNNFRMRLWVYSIGSTLLISFAPFVLLSLIPLQANTPENEPMLKVLLSFGSGGLLGDAFLHLIPHSQPAHQHGHGHSHTHLHSHAGSGHSHGPHDMAVGSYVLAGIVAFLTVEKFVYILRSGKTVHSHSHFNPSSSVDKKKVKERKKSPKIDKEKKSDISSAESLHSSDEEHEHFTKEQEGHEKEFKVTAYLNMAADFAHNFTDGLAIGASFLAGTAVGVVTMITVLVHEVPHEIGDFAILVQSGFSKKKAMSVQLLTALGALTGCILSLCAADASELSDTASSSWILPFTAGGFIYIATVTVIPELLRNTSTWQSIKEVTALLAGIILMYLIATFE